MLQHELVLADLQDVAGAQHAACRVLAVDERSVRAVQILENHGATLGEHARVMTRHRRVVDDHRVVRRAPDRQAHANRVLLQETPLILQR